MRYNFHLAFFQYLQDAEPTESLWTVLVDAFKDIWALCLRSASAQDLHAHLPQVAGYTPQELGDLWSLWQQEERVAFVEGFLLTIESEATGDWQRGRKLLAGKLRAVAATLSESKRLL